MYCHPGGHWNPGNGGVSTQLIHPYIHVSLLIYPYLVASCDLTLSYPILSPILKCNLAHPSDPEKYHNHHLHQIASKAISTKKQRTKKSAQPLETAKIGPVFWVISFSPWGLLNLEAEATNPFGKNGRMDQSWKSSRSLFSLSTIKMKFSGQ